MICRVCGRKVNWYYEKKGEPYCSFACKRIDKEGVEDRDKFKVKVELETGEVFNISPVENQIAFLLGAGYSVLEIVKIVKRPKSFVERLVEEPEIRRLADYYTKKYFSDFIIEVKRELFKRLREISKKDTKRDPLDWVRLFTGIIQPTSGISEESFNKNLEEEIRKLSKNLDDAYDENRD